MIARAFLAALRLEAITLLRTRETYTFALLPGLVGFPVFVAAVLIGTTLMRPPRVAMPREWPLLPPARWERVDTLDPAAAFDAGEVDLALVSAAPDGGGGWRVEGRWRDDAGRETLRRMLDDAARQRLDTELVAAGGTVARDRKVAEVAGGSRKGAGTDPTKEMRVVAGLAAMAAVYLGIYVVPVRLATERAGGLLESLAVARAPLAVTLVARIVAATALGLATPTLAGLSVWLMVGELLPAPPLVVGLEVAAIATFANAGFLLIGAVAGSSRTALGYSSLALLLGMPLGGLGLAFPNPWVPLLGFGDPDPGSAAARIAATLGAAAAMVGATAAWLRRDGAALPPSGGAA